MQFTSLLALSATLLASQVPAQYANPLVNPAAYSNTNLEIHPDPYANAYPSPNVNSNPMAAYMTPPMTPSKAHSLNHMSTHSAMHPQSSMGPMHSHIPMHQLHSMGSMVTKASSMSHSMAPLATPAPTHGLNRMHAPAQHVGNGGIAPVDPMAPGSGVAPVLMEKPHGQDVGNSFCMGSCYPSKEEARCAKPYVSFFFHV